MKIRYESTKNFFKSFNEANGIMMKKNSIIKNPSKKIKGFLNIIIFNIFLTLVFIILLTSIFVHNEIIYSYVMNIGIGVLSLVVYYYLMSFSENYSAIKKSRKPGYLIIDSDGITDESDTGITVKFNWASIELITITKNAITVIGDSIIFLFVDIEDKEKVAKQIKKYISDTTVLVEKFK